jgi:tRNA-dihydrouridine synthase 3
MNKYIASKPQDLPGVCPVFQAIGYCPTGIKCRWLASHYRNGNLVVDEAKKEKAASSNYEVHRVSAAQQSELQRKRFDFSLAEKVIKVLDTTIQKLSKAQSLSLPKRPQRKTTVNTLRVFS